MSDRVYMQTEKSKSIRHKVNEDRYLYTEYSFMGDQPIKLLIVADGMGGLEDGDKAAQNAVLGFSKAFYDKVAELYVTSDMDDFSMNYFADRMEDVIKASIQAANSEVCNKAASFKQTGTTISVVCILKDYAVVANVGDSPVYFYRKGRQKLSLISTLQTQAELDVEEGAYERYSPEYYANDHRIYVCLGQYSNLNEEDICCRSIGKLAAGDCFLIGSDGAFGRVSERDIQEMIEECGEDEGDFLLSQLFDMAQMDKDDDQTAILFMVGED